MRFDRGMLARPKRSGGALVVEGHAARVHRPGDPLRYSWGDEYRDAAELRRIVDRLMGVPVTLAHPEGMLRDGVRGHVVGRVDAAWVDGDHAAVRLSLTDSAAAREIEAGTKELSLGYLCGARADGHQTDTEIDHLAIVDSARCGSTCSLRTDEKPAVRLDCACQIDRSAAVQQSEVIMADPNDTAVLKVQLDEAAKLASERKDALDSAAGKVKTLEETIAKLEASATAGYAALETEAIKKHAERADSAESELVELKRTREDDIRKAAEIRIKAQSVMGSGFRVDGKTDDDICAVVIKKFAPKEDLASATSAYKRSRFDSLVEAYSANRESLDRAAESLNNSSKRETRTDSREARAKAWREQAVNGGYKERA